MEPKDSVRPVVSTARRLWLKAKWSIVGEPPEGSIERMAAIADGTLRKDDVGAKKFAKWEVVKYSAFLILFLYYIIVSSIEPEGPEGLLISMKWYIWMPIAAYIIFYEGFRYFRVYYKMGRGVIDMYTLIGVASHAVFVYALVLSALNPNAAVFDPHVPALWELPGVIIIVAVVGERIEESIRRDTSDAFKSIYQMKKNQVVIRDGENTRSVDVGEVAIGDIMVISKGQMVSIDGQALEDGEFDYSNITGEALGKRIKAGDDVTSGSYNVGTTIDIKAVKLAKDSTIFTVVDTLIEAAGNKPALQKIAESILKRFVYLVCIMALIAFIVWTSLGAAGVLEEGLTWVPVLKEYRVTNAGDSVGLGVLALVMVMSVACPEALGIAAPIILLVSATSLQRNGIIINKPYAVQGLQSIKIVAFDKTGTITTDRLVINDSHNNNGGPASEFYASLAKSIEHNIPHPIAKAFELLDVPLLEVDDVTHNDSHGVEATYNGKKYVVQGENLAEFHDRSATIVGLREDGELVATFELQNEIKDGVRKVIADLKRSHVKTVMLTGDAEHVAKWVAEQVGIDEYKASLKPNDKHVIISDLRRRGKVMFVGDGFNDSLASQAADISVAFASGSDIVNNISDFSIASNDFKAINILLLTGHLNNVYTRWSVVWALAFNFMALPLAVMMLVPPWLTAILLSVSDLMIVATVLTYRRHLEIKTARRLRSLQAIKGNAVETALAVEGE